MQVITSRTPRNISLTEKQITHNFQAVFLRLFSKVLFTIFNKNFMLTDWYIVFLHKVFNI